MQFLQLRYYLGKIPCFIVWSFGNNQRTYIFGKNVEAIKHAGHELVVNCDSELIKGLISDDAIDRVLSKPDRISRRLELRAFITDRKFELQHVEQLQQPQRLQQLQHLESLELYSLNYNKIIIPTGAIIYCDPPYKGTSEYKEGSFNHAEFWDWCREISKTHKIYIS